jgi:cyanophycinase
MRKTCLLLSLGILLAVSLAPAQTAAAPQAKAPAPKVEPVKGTLFIIGGGDYPESFTKMFIALAERFQSGKIVIFTTANENPQKRGPEAVKEFKAAGAKNAVWVHLTHDQAMVEGHAAVLDDAGGVFFTGGDQIRLTAALLGTPVLAKIMDLYRWGAVIGGNSAGAAIMSEVMITGDDRDKPGGEEAECEKFRTIKAGNIVTVPGFGFITSAVIDQHHIVRKRENRLFSVIGEHPDLLGVAIDENTVIIVDPDQTFEVVGESSVLVLDPGQAKVQVLPTKQISIENMTLHLLTSGMRFSLKDRKVVH